MNANRERNLEKSKFLASLAQADRQFLMDKNGHSVRGWAHEPQAKAIHAAALESGLYSRNTVAVDTLAALRNLIVRTPSLLHPK
jgi:hypothetical protein